MHHYDERGAHATSNLMGNELLNRGNHINMCPRQFIPDIINYLMQTHACNNKTLKTMLIPK